MPPITNPQLKKLNVLYGQLARRDLDLDSTRDTRLRWARECLAINKLGSFRELSSDQARRLLDIASDHLGLAHPTAAPYSRAAALRRGVEGRHDGQKFADQPQIVSAKQLDEIARLYTQLGMDQERFEKFIAARSPFGKGKTVIRTSADANKVRFALLAMLRREGKNSVAGRHAA